MAYFNFLAAVSELEIERFRSDPTVLLNPSLILGASHLLAYWVQEQPLGSALRDAIDGGEPLHPSLWHPLRPPIYHRPAKVRTLVDAISAAWEPMAGALTDDGGWLSAETARVLRLYRHAAGLGGCVVSALEAPADAGQTSRVRVPWRKIPGG